MKDTDYPALYARLDAKWIENVRKRTVFEDDPMAEVTRFEDKVKQAMKDVMRHAVAGHSSNSIDWDGSGFNTFCNDPMHALHILAEHGIRPVNEGTAARFLDKA